jgi:hypothetical protein
MKQYKTRSTVHSMLYKRHLAVIKPTISSIVPNKNNRISFNSPSLYIVIHEIELVLLQSGGL